MSAIHHALVLNLHQPPGNLDHLLSEQPWEAREILYAYDRIPRFLWDYDDIARVHLSLSGTLLETLSNPEFQSRVYGIVDCGSLIWHLQNERIIDILGTGYYHPVLPLIPEADRDEHLARWQAIAGHLFWRNSFQGFWPPEMGFSMELIPLLKKFGYRYVIVDSEHVEPVTPMQWHELRYRPHIARHNGSEIIVIVRDRELSDAQESGMDYVWFAKELAQRTQCCDFEPLVTTCTDGENGGWFRNTTNEVNFWGAFYRELLDEARKKSLIQPAFIKDYLDRFGAYGEVTVRTGAWNTGWHHGRDFLQWTGSQTQKDSLARLQAVSMAVHQARNAAVAKDLTEEEQGELNEAFWRLLRAETSCNFYWGEDWVHRCHNDLDEAEACLQRYRARGS
ncbi:glycoside hydrolase family 57 [Methylocaldum sp.]|jgi:alpha-amylase/alpha-mannosidase (GH57 family)|uniref:glycoside hydrolase family 57 n=1 Tax=unclassified Methylocaldum TaxID=2622260 RepID=UPI00293B1C4E|nr:glycoside hydrolase family 57 [Methylocaldum sp.]